MSQAKTNKFEEVNQKEINFKKFKNQMDRFNILFAYLKYLVRLTVIKLVLEELLDEKSSPWFSSLPFLVLVLV